MLDLTVAMQALLQLEAMGVKGQPYVPQPSNYYLMSGERINLTHAGICEDLCVPCQYKLADEGLPMDDWEHEHFLIFHRWERRMAEEDYPGMVTDWEY